MAHELSENDVLQLRICNRFGQQAGLIIRHFVVRNLVGTTVNVGHCANTFDTLFSAAMKALMGAAAEYVCMAVKRLFPSPTDEFINADSQGVGGVAGDMCPPQIAGLVKLTTGIAGRANRGRFYSPFPAEGDCAAGGVPSVGYIARLETLAGLLVGTTTVTNGDDTADLKGVVLHRDPENPTITELDFYVAREFWATQRRRGFFGAANIVP